GIEHTEEDGFVKNIYNSFKRFETDEVENALVKVELGSYTWQFRTDKEGYVYVDEAVNLPVNTSDKIDWIPLHFKLLMDDQITYETKSELMLPSENTQYGIISDLDDTVLDTGISSTFKYKVIMNTFFKHSSKRMPLEGVLDFYKLLHKGDNGKYDNPFFYLSNSPWNLHEYLIDFLNRNQFPKGVLLLRDIGFENKRKTNFLERNKFLKISHILKTYPSLPFILIGDAADIDHDITLKLPGVFRIGSMRFTSVPFLIKRK
ncbi:MAG: DUF2183 domain-containing protein, partial [Flavobacteriaceae bacterium]|nr:DUF2183 domain-containing protein [Flavobacteriaceae bacterium]